MDSKLQRHSRRGMVVVHVRHVALLTVSSLGLFWLFCSESQAEIACVRPTLEGETPYIQVEEFSLGSKSVSAEFYAFLKDAVNSKTTTVYLQYVKESGYEPEAPKPSERYAAGTEILVADTGATEPELHVHLVLEPDQIYHYRIFTENADGTCETPDETAETYPASRGAPPDGRAYEQVSPVDKNNLDALGIGRGMTMQASPSSLAPAFAFFSFEPFPVAVGTTNLTTDYLSTRTSSPAWSTQGVQAPIEPVIGAGHNEISGFTEDLAKTIAQVYGPPLGLPGEFNAYVRDNATGSYQLLASNVGGSSILFADASRDDSRILFETEQQLLPAAAAGKTNLYEWDEGKPEGKRLSLAGVLSDGECVALSKSPGCAPANGSGAGPGGGLNQTTTGQDYLENTVSEDGSKIFFTGRLEKEGHKEERIYEREPLAEPAPITVPVSAGAATFLAATPSGRYVFYSEDGELHRFDTTSEVSEALTSDAENIIGSLGVSNEGDYAYFVASGVLAVGGNANGEEAIKGSPNLYVWHEGAITFIARLLPTPEEGDASDWLNANVELEGKTSRVNPSGTALLFTSRASLTGYDNGRLGSSACSQGNGKQIPCTELFLYDAEMPPSSSNLICVSCNPSGAMASNAVHLSAGEFEVALHGPEWSPHLTRNLSADGNRVFFETAESLVPRDVNGVTDVYEWEREGVGSCPSGEGDCLYLISSGTAHARSFFGDASASGDDVFFFTRQPLVSQDSDLNFDVYDARVGGGIPAQNPSAEVCEGEECKPLPSRAPALGAPRSTALSGSGNIVPKPPPPTCPKGRKLSHGKCVAIKCAKHLKLSHSKCVKVRKKAKSRGHRTKGKHAARRGRR